MTEETLEKLAQLLEQDQFELLIPEKMRTESGRISDKASASMDIPLVYLMNDAVESFLVFRNVRMTGEYRDANGVGYTDNGDGTWTDENGNSYTE